jgi:chromate reductase, NAD(P)H dehydrogenase (quinone)
MPSAIETTQSQLHLRQVFVFLNSMLLNRPEVMISSAHARFDDIGNFTDEMSRTVIHKMLVLLADRTRRLTHAY